MKTKFNYLKTQSQLFDCLDEMHDSDTIGLDLEFDKNRYAFGFNLSLIQINNGKEIFLVDALQIEDLEGVFNLLSDPSKKKIVFAFGEDIRLLHSIGCFPKNISDLSIAANLLNFPPCSLSSLTNKVLDIEEKDSSQKSNWLKRPLTDAQLEYAAEDVRYLIQLGEELDDRIEEKNIQQWLGDENLRYDISDYSEVQSFSPIKNKEKRELTEYQFYLLEQLMSLRESIAEAQNKPGYHIVSKDVLLQLAKGELMLKDMFAIKGISKYFKKNDSKTAIHSILSEPKQKSTELGLSLTSPAIKKLSKEEYKDMMERKKASDRIINSILLPIKEEVKKVQGENTASFIFSNKIMTDISRDGLSSQPPYKQKIVWELARQLNIDLKLLS